MAALHCPLSFGFALYTRSHGRFQGGGNGIRFANKPSKSAPCLRVLDGPSVASTTMYKPEHVAGR